MILATCGFCNRHVNNVTVSNFTCQHVPCRQMGQMSN